MGARLQPPSFLAFLALFAWCGTAFPVCAQEKKVRSVPFEGPEVFAHVLFQENIKPIASIEEAAADPENSVIIVFGNPGPLAKLPGFLAGQGGYRQDGGNLFVATDQRKELFEVGVNITGVQISQHANPYRGRPECPWLTYSNKDHPLFQSLQRGIATNCPSRISIRLTAKQSKSLKVHSMLAFKGPVFDAETNVQISGGGADYMVASSKDTPPRGRTLIVAGHGMFINGMMMLHQDNDNYAFAQNAVRWLTEDKAGKPRRALFIYEGRVITDFNMNLAPSPALPIPTVKMLDRLVRGLEEERFFHRVLKELLGSRLGLVVTSLLGALTFSLLMYGAKKLIASRSHLEAAVPSMVGAPPAPNSEAALEQRGQALLRKSDFWKEARQLTLEWFRAEFDVTPETWRDGVQANFHAKGALLARWRLQRKADFALRLARISTPRRVSRHQFFGLLESLQQLSQACKGGQLALLVEGKNVRQV